MGLTASKSPHESPCFVGLADGFKARMRVSFKGIVLASRYLFDGIPAKCHQIVWMPLAVHGHGRIKDNKKAHFRGLFEMLLDLGSGQKTWKWCQKRQLIL